MSRPYRYKEIIKAEIEYARDLAEQYESRSAGAKAEANALDNFPNKADQARFAHLQSATHAGRASAYRDIQRQLESAIKKAEPESCETSGGDDA